jgi:P27 family predicted phage terminase small subunit
MGVRGPVPDPKKQTGRLGKPVRRVKLKVLAGPTGSVTPPSTLASAGILFWNNLVTADWITAADHPALERLCMIYDELDEFGSVIDKDGPQVPGSTMQPVAHPLLTIIDRWRTAASKLEIELGLTPLARQRMHLGVERKSQTRPTATDNPYADLRVGIEGDARSNGDVRSRYGHLVEADPRHRLHSDRNGTRPEGD